MIDIDVKLTGDITGGLDKLQAKIRESVLLSGVAAMARVIYNEVKLNTSGARKGGPGDPPGVVTGTLHKSVYRVYAKDESDADRKVYKVSVNKSKAPHWHLLEFGTSRMRARPYIRPAFDHVQDAIRAGKARMADRLAEGQEAISRSIDITDLT